MYTYFKDVLCVLCIHSLASPVYIVWFSVCIDLSTDFHNVKYS